MSIQYTVPWFELTTFGTWVSSHNHQTRAPTQIYNVLNIEIYFSIFVNMCFYLMFNKNILQ